MFLRNALLLALLSCGTVLAQPCMTSFTATASPMPVNGTYGCGETVTFCFTVTNWNSTNSNWFHGIEANFGPGWDMATLVPGVPPPTCGLSTGTWGWETSIGGQGPGFFFDLDSDGDPSNNFGDFCTGATDWEFCWTITTVSGAACISGLDCGVTIDTFSDSQTGSWGSAGCGGDTNPPVFPGPVSIAACNVDPGAGGPISVCSTGADVALFNVLTGTPDAGGVWTGPSNTPHTGTLQPSIDVSGNYTYTVTSIAPPCSQSAVIAVTVNQQPVAGTDGIAVVCASDVAFPLIDLLGGAPTPGGSWNGPTGPSTGTFDPAVNSGGIYTYSFPGAAPCNAVSATVNVTVNPTPSAGNNAAFVICSNGAPTNLFVELGGTPDAGGTWTGPSGEAFNGTYDPSTNVQGVHTYTVLGVAPCANSSATVTVTENIEPNAGLDAAVTVCNSSSAFNMYNSLGGTPTAGGIWTDPNGGVVSAILDPVTAINGAYTYLVNGVAPCISAQAILTVNVIPAPNAGGNGMADVCNASPPFQLDQFLTGSPDPGGVWTGFNNAPVSGTFTPGTSIPGTFTYTVTGIAPCVNATATVTVSVSPQPSAGIDALTALCNTGEPVDLFTLLGGSPVTGGTWTGPNGSVVPVMLNPALAPIGVYTYTVTSIAPCTNDQATVDITIVSEPDPGTDGAVSLCEVDLPIDLFTELNGAPDPGGSWQGPNGPLVGLFNPSTGSTGTYTYTVNAPAPCIAQTAEVIVSVIEQPNAGIDDVTSVCNTALVPVDLFGELGGSPDMGGIWTAPDGQVHPSSYAPGIDMAGVYTYSLTALAPCSSVSSTITISEVQAPDAGPDLTLDLCEDLGELDPMSWLGPNTDTNGVWLDPNGIATISVDAATATSGDFIYTLTGTVPCPNDQATVNVAFDDLPDAGLDNILQLCADGSQNLLPLLGPDAEPTGTWSGPLGNFYGVFNADQDPAGQYTYTVDGSGGCIGRSALSVVDVSVNDLPEPLFGLGPISGCVPLQVQFTLTDPVALTSIEWSFGDGESEDASSMVWHTYDAVGTFNVSVEVVDNNGCYGTTVLQNAVFTSNGPEADFIVAPLRVSILEPNIHVSHVPESSVMYGWTLDNDTIIGADEFDWTIDPVDVGIYTLCKIATDTLGCSNSTCSEIIVDDVLTIFVPNAFTPDGNDINEEFMPSVLGAAPGSFSFAIFDRWGNKVFSTNEIGHGWNGGMNNNGNLLPQDVYVWRLTARDQFGTESVEHFGSVTLLK
ncbi:MAG: gliding motility-associated C-terminal domain-containing protein [Flavobacteriales bacterium]|nr:gliding motility-associated C-terminal domain-containing protein [Flavobacteriales bacterium]